MRHLVIRTGSRIRQRLSIVVAVAAVVFAVITLVRPRRWYGRPELQLVALNASGFFEDSVYLPRAWADTTFNGAYGASARVPLILGVRNIGTMEGAARALHLSLPARYRLEFGDGRELPHELSAGNPLIRYTIHGPFPPIQPGRLPVVLPSVDTVWLDPVVPQFYCVSVGDSIPEFIPATAPDPRLLSHIDIFYSFNGRPGRQAGLLTLELDSSLVQPPPAATPPSFPTRMREPGWPLPPMGPLHRVGTTEARCGPPEQPMEVQSTIWADDAGARLIALVYGGKVRKYLFALKRDGMVDLEMWDASGKGRFDAERAAHYPIPSFLLPPAGPPPFNPSVFAGISADSAARLSPFHDAGAFKPPPSPGLRTAQKDTAPKAPVASAAPAAAFSAAGGYSPRGPQPRPSPDGNVAAGTTITAPTPARPAAPRTATPGTAAPSPPKLLGRPVQTTPGTPADTSH